MGDPRSVLEGSSASVDDSCPWTEVSPSNTRHAPRNREHLDFLLEFDRSVVSVGRKIGEGGQGCVYEAKLHLPYSFKPFPMAVKKFKPFEGVSQGHFPWEMGSAKSINLCVPDGVFFEGDSLCMIMTRFSCDLRVALDSHMKTLRDEVLGTNGPPCTGPPCPEEVGRLIIWYLAMGLKALHECGVYHGDLKAANILLRIRSEDYETPLLKFAHLVIADFERSEGVVGTGFWRAPEVLQSLVTDIPLSKEQWLLADVYSFGMVCYEVLTGMIPFQGHPVSDYDLVLNGGRPELPDYIPEPVRDLIVRCWHVDPHSRPNWSEIIDVFAPNDDSVTSENPGTFISLVSVESLSFESLMHEAKQLVRDLTELHESDSKSFESVFMPFYWASKYLATVEEYASKFDMHSSPERLLPCSVQKAFEKVKLLFLLVHQMYGARFDYLTFIDLLFEGRVVKVVYLQVMILAIYRKVFQQFSKQEFTNEYEIGTSWIGKLVYFHALVKWVLWYEHVDYGMFHREAIGECLVQSSIIQALLFFLCMILNTYIYILAMITYEPILLGLQYGLYKAKGCNNILYQSSGERICRFQRVWMNCTRYKIISIILSFSFVTLVTMYGWRGIFSWILFPCVIIFTPYWRRPILVTKGNYR